MDCAKVWLSKERAERKDASCPICRTVSATACSRFLSLRCAFTAVTAPSRCAALRFHTAVVLWSAAGRGAAECHLEGEGTCRERLSGGDVCYEGRRRVVCLGGHQ